MIVAYYKVCRNKGTRNSMTIYRRTTYFIIKHFMTEKSECHLSNDTLIIDPRSQLTLITKQVRLALGSVIHRHSKEFCLSWPRHIQRLNNELHSELASDVILEALHSRYFCPITYIFPFSRKRLRILSIIIIDAPCSAVGDP